MIFQKFRGIIGGSLLLLVILAGIFEGKPDKKSNTVFSSTPSPQVEAAQTTSTPLITLSDPNISFAKVAIVIDGDTIEIEGGKRVRLIGIDTPETVDPNRPVGCYGKEASNFTKSQLLDKEIKLEKDVSEIDKYGRLLRYVWLDDILFNETLVKEGYAQSTTYPPDVKYQDRFVTAQTEARSSEKGLWSNICAYTPTPKANTPATKPVAPNQTNTSSGSCKYSCTSPDRDCSDFSTHAEAQTFFNCCNFSATNDPMRLDNARGVGNGLACESLP